MLRLLVQLFAASCTATVLAVALGVAYLGSTGKLDKQKTFQILAVVHDVDLSGLLAADSNAANRRPAEQLSYESIEKRRAIETRHLEFKMNNLQKDLQEVRMERQLVETDREQLKKLMAGFDLRLQAVEEQARRAGIEQQRQIWTKLKPALAKDQIMSMVEAGEIKDVVRILSDMSPSTQAKIISEFNKGEGDNEDERDAVDEILREIRYGVSTVSLVDQTRAELNRNQ